MGQNYRINITEQKTQKNGTFIVPLAVYQFLYMYCEEHGIKKDDTIFPSRHGPSKTSAEIADYLGYENIGTHSFRKFLHQIFTKPMDMILNW